MEPWVAVHNAKEIPDIIIDHCSGKKEFVPPILGIYTDGGPEQRSNFLSVQIAHIGLQQFLDLDMLVAAEQFLVTRLKIHWRKSTAY